MDWIWATGLFAIVYVLQAWIYKSKNKKIKKLPPGPRGFPIIGNLLMLGEFPHVDLHRLAQKHGDIMYLRLGLVPTIIVSSPQAAELFLKTHDLAFATRPPHEAAKHISYGQRNLSYAEYGSYWRTIRKMCTLELLSNHKINSFKSMRKEELDLFINFIREASCYRATVDLSAKVSSLNAAMTCRLVFGKKYMDKEFDEKGFQAWIHEGMHLAGTPNFGDYLPFLAPFDLQGLTKRMKAVSKVFDDFFEKIIDEHIESQFNQERNKDFVDVMLGFMGSNESEYKIERANIKAIILDMVSGGIDTSATAIEWTLAELMRHPRVMKKVQKELEDVVGMERMVDESDLEKLEYLNMVVKENLRLHPVAPLLIPHAAIEDCTVNGFHIPEKSHVIVNVWAVGRDPSAWTDPDMFIPERFDGSNIDLRGRDFQLLPFGSGRRGCPGMHLGLTVVLLVVAQLVHCFDWELPDNMLPTELDMTEEFGLTVPRAKHLLAIPSYRLRQQ
ncbi:cytochrome P450 71AU50-like [Argentina anserina]|uniref:cytochrome P450 71AU50-like n=1 Tax=Argentina anserina TaxID=57926 RepID=UPI0021767480|nr:cytochrome P450 71AU50-like [Potentilla anserina]